MSVTLLRYLIFVAPAVALGLAACQGCHSSSTPTTPTTGGDVGPPTVRLYLVSDLAGALEPCGCTKDQLGGLDHFGAWVKQSQPSAPASLVAAAGPLFFLDPQLEVQHADQDKAKADTIARVLHEVGFAATAPGRNDWAEGMDGYVKLVGETGGVAIVATQGPQPPIATSSVREIGGLKVGFVGYGQPDGTSPAPAGASSKPGEDDATGNVETFVKRGVDDVKKQGASVVVALAAVGRGEAKRIADAVPELTAVVVGGAKLAGEGNTTAPPAERIGDVLIVETGNHLQSVAVLDLYVRDAVTPGTPLKFADASGVAAATKRDDLTHQIDDLHVKIAAWERDPSIAPGDVAARRVQLAQLEAQRDALDVRPAPARGSFFRYTVKEIRASLGEDPSVVAQMLAYYKSVDARNRAAFADRLPRAAAPGEATYVGIEVCTSCHAPARKVWDSTPHSRAYATLADQFKEFNLDCVGCHVTGYEKPGGTTVTHVEKLTNVQCEVCHGPGSKHVAEPKDTTKMVARPDPSSCTACHHPPHVEQFDATVKLREILGPGHGMPPE
jgi:hypothetical protein